MGIIVALSPLAITIFVVVYVVRSVIRLRRGTSIADDAAWHMHAFTTLDDLIGQLLLGIALTLGVIGLGTLSRRLGLPVEPEHVLLVAVIAGFMLAWRMRAPALYVLAALGSYGWWSASAWRLTDAAKAGGIAVVVGAPIVALLLMGAGRLFEREDRGRRFGYFSWLFGLLGMLVFLFGASSIDGLQVLSAVSGGSPFGASVPLAILVGGGLVTSASVLIAAARSRTMAAAEAAYLVLVFIAVAALTVFPPTDVASSEADLWAPGGPQLTAAGTAWASGFNVLLLAGLLGLVFLGYVRRENWLVNFGAVLLFVFVVVKYFDWLFTFLDRSIAFIVAGLLFLGVGAAMERGRRYVLHAMEPTDA